MSRPLSEQTNRWSAARHCCVCLQDFQYPLADEDKWTTIPLGTGHYFRCPDCTASGKVPARKSESAARRYMSELGQ